MSKNYQKEIDRLQSVIFFGLLGLLIFNIIVFSIAMTCRVSEDDLSKETLETIKYLKEECEKYSLYDYEYIYKYRVGIGGAVYDAKYLYKVSNKEIIDLILKELKMEVDIIPEKTTSKTVKLVPYYGNELNRMIDPEDWWKREHK